MKAIPWNKPTVLDCTHSEIDVLYLSLRGIVECAYTEGGNFDEEGTLGAEGLRKASSMSALTHRLYEAGSSLAEATQTRLLSESIREAPDAHLDQRLTARLAECEQQGIDVSTDRAVWAETQAAANAWVNRRDAAPGEPVGSREEWDRNNEAAIRMNRHTNCQDALRVMLSVLRADGKVDVRYNVLKDEVIFKGATL